MFEPNLHVAGVLEELAFLLEITGGNPFKIRAYRQAARTLKSFPEPLEDVRQLDGIKGIGAGIKGIVEEVLSGALPEELRELRDQVPAGIFDIARLPGLGPKSLKTLMDSGITDLETLEEKAKDKSLAALPGFGQKTVERILESLEELKNHMDLHLGYDALLFARRLTDKICQFPGNKIIETQITGEVRRFAPQVTTVEIAVKTVPDFSEEDLAEFLLLESTGENGIYRHPEGYTVKLYFATDKDFGTVLLRTTGPEEFTSAFGELLDAPDEKTLFANKGFFFVPPELRHTAFASDYLRGSPPRLVELGDIKGDLHVHSNYSDGVATILEMAKKAQSLGYQYIGISDHSKSLVIANGLDGERLLEQGREIDGLCSAGDLDIWILKATEVDILKDGSLDLDDDVLSKLDFVTASVHSSFRMTKTEMTERIIRAMENPFVRSIGHITGRLLGRRPGYDIDWDRIIKEAKKTSTALELNASPERLDVPEEFLREVTSNGVKIVINTDAHSPEGLMDMVWGVMTARRGLVEPHHVLNTYSAADFKSWLREGHK